MKIISETGETSLLKKLDFFNLEDIDLLIKFLYVKAKVENNNYEFYKNLYKKAILRFFWGVNDGKSKISEFIESFDTLIESIQNIWFDKKHPIIISKNDMILNGRHRLAICEYFWIEPVLTRSNDRGHKRFIMDLDFYKTVFSEFEIETIITDYFNHFENPDYFVSFLWGDSEKRWNDIEASFEKKWVSSIAYKKTFTYQDLNHFQNILEWIYVYENGINNNMNILLKIQGLKNNMKFQVLVCKYEGEKTYRYNISDYPICVEVEEMKFSIRKELSDGESEKKYSFLHTSDNHNHVRYLTNFIFNPNTRFLRHIYSDNKYMNSTLKLLKKFERFLENNNASRYDFCFESGIILQIFWIRRAADLDFICLEKLRSTLSFFEKDVDLHEENRFFKISKLRDDVLISNWENYFFYKGFKFVSPDLLIKNSSHLSKKKNLDMTELRNLIDKENKYQLNILYKIKVFFLLKYYWIRRRIVDVLTLILSEKQKYIIKKLLNKYFWHNYNLHEDE